MKIPTKDEARAEIRRLTEGHWQMSREDLDATVKRIFELNNLLIFSYTQTDGKIH